jgi:hypothetical protein
MTRDTPGGSCDPLSKRSDRAEDGTDRKSAPRSPDNRQYVLLRPAPGKTHIAIAIARICIRAGFHGRFSDPVDLGNLLEVEGRAGRQGQLADYLSRLTCGLN